MTPKQCWPWTGSQCCVLIAIWNQSEAIHHYGMLLWAWHVTVPLFQDSSRFLSMATRQWCCLQNFYEAATKTRLIWHRVLNKIIVYLNISYLKGLSSWISVCRLHYFSWEDPEWKGVLCLLAPQMSIVDTLGCVCVLDNLWGGIIAQGETVKVSYEIHEKPRQTLKLPKKGKSWGALSRAFCCTDLFNKQAGDRAK